MSKIAEVFNKQVDTAFAEQENQLDD